MGMDEVVKASLRRIPSVDSLLADPQWDRYRVDLGAKVVAEAVREAVDVLRRQVVDGVAQGLTDAGLRDMIAAEAVRRLKET